MTSHNKSNKRHQHGRPGRWELKLHDLLAKANVSIMVFADCSWMWISALLVACQKTENGKLPEIVQESSRLEHRKSSLNSTKSLALTMPLTGTRFPWICTEHCSSIRRNLQKIDKLHQKHLSNTPWLFSHKVTTTIINCEHNQTTIHICID